MKYFDQRFLRNSCSRVKYYTQQPRRTDTNCTSQKRGVLLCLGQTQPTTPARPHQPKPQARRGPACFSKKKKKKKKGGAAAAGRVLAAGDGPLRLLFRPAPPPRLQLHPSRLRISCYLLLLLFRLRPVAHRASSVLHIRRRCGGCQRATAHHPQAIRQR
jgi:hypothetical protein